MYYQVIGNYSEESETLLEEFDLQSEATAWVKGYTRSGDWGGYDVIDIVQRDENDAYVAAYRYYKYMES